MRMSSSQRERGNGNGNGGGSCQDCGNKAKRECEYLRCRTCCKSRGFHCPTHVKSTWVPVARRRHRLSLPPPFSRFLHLTTPNPSSSGLQGRNHSFPAEIKTVANFRQVRTNTGDNSVDQAAYQTSVNIGGHLFSGILYDQGPSSAFPGGGESSNSAADHHQYLHQHHQLSGMTPSAAHPIPYNSPNPHQYTFYGSGSPPLNANLLPGMQFLPHPKP